MHEPSGKIVHACIVHPELYGNVYRKSVYSPMLTRNGKFLTFHHVGSAPCYVTSDVSRCHGNVQYHIIMSHA